MTDRGEQAGCRDSAIASLALLAFAVVFMAVGLAMTGRADCRGVCETSGLTLLYAGGPISALLGVAFGGVWVAWPLEITLWVVVGFAAARFSGGRPMGVLGVVLAIVGIALAYGLVLSLFVEIAI